MNANSIEQFDAEQQKVIDRVEKLLRLAARNTNAEEAASATAKAQELLAAYNLDASMISPDEDKSAVREKMKIKGGMYEYQRELYRAVAELNFCIYWTLVNKKWVVRNKVDKWTGEKRPTDVLSKEFQHYVIGRLVNTRSTRIMAEYIRQALERLVNERYPNNARWSADAVAFREGASDVIVDRLRAKRRDMEVAERKKRAEEVQSSGVGMGNALTIASYTKQENDANLDFIYGEGYTARIAAERAERARKLKEAEEAYTVWAAAHPEEARKEAEERKKEQEKQRRRWLNGGQGSRGGRTARDKRSDKGEYWHGRNAGESISLDPQVDDRPHGAPKRIGRG